MLFYELIIYFHVNLYNICAAFSETNAKVKFTFKFNHHGSKHVKSTFPKKLVRYGNKLISHI